MATQTCHVCNEKFPYHAPVCDKSGAQATFWQLYGRMVGLILVFVVFTLVHVAFMVVYVIPYCLFWHLPHLLYYAYKRKWAWAKPRLIKIACYALVLLAIFGFIALENSLKRDAAEPFIAALATYKKATGDYPKDPQVLVPKYLSELPPLAKSLDFGAYYYYRPAEPGMEADFPSVGFYTRFYWLSRWYYRFDRKEWRYMGD